MYISKEDRNMEEGEESETLREEQRRTNAEALSNIECVGRAPR